MVPSAGRRLVRRKRFDDNGNMEKSKQTRRSDAPGALAHSDAVRVLAALAQETRLRVFRLLVQAGARGLTVGEIADRLEVPNATLSFHLKELANADLVETRQEGRFVRCTAGFGRMDALLGFLLANCCEGADCAPARTARRRAPARAC